MLKIPFYFSLLTNYVRSRGSLVPCLVFILASATLLSASTSGPVGYWSFDEGNGITVTDFSGNGNTGTLVNGPRWNVGKSGYGLSFDGLGQYVEIADSNNRSYNKALTLSAWIYNPGAGNSLVPQSEFRIIAAKGWAPDAGGSWTLGWDKKTNDLSFCVRKKSDKDYNCAFFDYGVLTNDWHHVTALFNHGKISLYLDGSLAAGPTGLGSEAMMSNDEEIRIGAVFPTPTSFLQTWEGFIDEVQIYNRALTPAQIKALYESTGSQKTSNSQTSGLSAASTALNVNPPVATPLISPDGGSYTSAVSVKLATATGKASIYYTLDGTTPTQSSTLYRKPFTVTNTTNVKAKAFKAKMDPSLEASAWFNMDAFDFSLANSGDKTANKGIVVQNAISATLTSGNSQSVSFSVSGLPSGASSSLSTTVCGPSCSSTLTINTTSSTPVGTFPITVTGTGAGISRSTSFSLTVSDLPTVTVPTITPNGGSYTGSAAVTMQSATSGASIYYTTDGSTPTQASQLYVGSITLTSSAVLKARAFKSGYVASSETSASFTLSPSVLVAHWKFDEGTGTTVFDSSGNSNNGTLVNGPQWSAGRNGSALYFDGTDDHVTVLHSNSLNLSNSFTLSAWVDPASSFSDFRSILVKNYKYYLYASVAGYCGDGSPLGGFNDVTEQTACQPAPLPTNTWTHVSLSYNGSTLTLYRDGVPVSTANAAGFPATTEGTLQIGASQYGEYFKGLIDEVRIYSKALSDTEIQAIYQQESVETSQTVATPVISPGSGSYAGSIPVTIQTATSGASIYYTTNGSTPTQSSTLYSGSLTLASSATVKTKAFKNGYNASTERAASFTISQPFSFSLSNSGNQSVSAASSVTNPIGATLASGSSQAVSFSVAGLPLGASGSFSSVSCSPSCSTILHITTTPSTAVGNYSINVTATGGGVTKTTTFTLGVTLAFTVATPTITPNGGSFSGSVSVAMQTTTSGASIYYTMDGSTPTQSASLYTGAMTLSSSTTVNAKAFKSGSNPSAVASASFTSTVTGESYYVSKAGSNSNSCAQARNQSTPKLTINAGIDCLTAGDTLYIRAGTYDEQFYRSFPSGTSWSKAVTIAAHPGETVIIKPTSAAGPNCTKTPSGFGTISGPCRVITMEKTSFLIFDRLILDAANTPHDAVKLTAQYDGSGNPIPGTAPHHIRFQNSEIKNALWSNCFLIDALSENNEFLNLKVHDCGTSDVNYGPGHNVFYNSGSYNLFDRVTVWNSSGGGIMIWNQIGTPSYNIVRNSVAYNMLTGKAAGIGIYKGKENKAYNNIVYNNVGPGITVDHGATDTKVFNNTAYQNRGFYGRGIAIGTNTSGTIVKNNIAWRNEAQDLYNASQGSTLSNNLTNDPKFLDPFANDFRLQSGSPAIDAGTDLRLDGVNADATGAPRPQGIGYDVGAYEFGS